MATAQTADVVIVGAGAAGLACAAELVRSSSHSIVVLEARDRIGGRCFTRFEPGLAAPVELGAEFIHGHSRPILSLLKKHRSTALRAPKLHWFGDEGKLRLRENLLPEIRRALSGRNTLHKRDLTFNEYIKKTLRGKLSPEALAFARAFVEGYDAADPASISALEVVEEWRGGGGADSAVARPRGGYQPLLESLAGTLDDSRVRVHLQTRVKNVTWRRGKVEITGLSRGKPFHVSASQAVITLPVGVLKLPQRSPHAVKFRPALAQKRAAVEKMDAGSVVKIALRFRSAFWESVDGGRYRHAAFLHSAHTMFPTFWTALPLRAPLLIAWTGGPRARRLAGRETADITRLALASLESIFSRRAMRGQFLNASVHDWQRDPYCRGAYSSVMAGGQGARETLAKPLRDTLYFAGEATDLSGEASTVGGALQSGIRAARELLLRR